MKIGIVIVTYNRLELLKKALNSVDNQTYICDYVVVVDNCSTDGTKDFLLSWEKENAKYIKYTVFLDKNIGGSGGYHEGIKKANDLDSDWVFVFDDDALLESNCLEKLNDFISNNKCDDLSAICTSVKNKDGKFELGHRSFVSKDGLHIHRYSVPVEKYNENIYIDGLSFVGALINAKAIKKVGFPVRDFFIWQDDLEYSIRLKKYGKILLIPSIFVNHYDDFNTGVLYWKRYYGIRNYVYILKLHFPLIYFLAICKYLVLFIPRAIKNRKKNDNTLINDAYHDAVFNKMGINYKYFPKKTERNDK